MSNARSDWAYAPSRRARPAGPASASVAPPVLALLIGAVLVAGIVGVAIHHRSSSAATPAGFQRLVDSADHLSVAVPNSWQVSPGSATLSTQLQKLKGSSPQVSALADRVLAALQQVQIGVFAVDAASGTVLYTYGTDQPGGQTTDQVTTAPLVTQLRALGATDIQATTAHLPLGTAQQVSAAVSLGGVPVSEVVDVLAFHNRVVVFAIAVRGTRPPVGLVHQIQGTLAPA